MSTPVIILNSSPERCCVVPFPPDAMLILPGLALAWAMNSGTVLAGTDRFTSMTLGTRGESRQAGAPAATDRFALLRCALRPGERQQPLLDAEIDGGEV